MSNVEVKVKNRKFCKKEQDLLQKLKNENDKLKKELSRLRKQFKRVDDKRFEVYRDVLSSYSIEKEREDNLQALKEKWMCYDCGRGVLVLKKLKTLEGLNYYRKCNNCSKRTKLQTWKEGVKGIE